MRIIKYFFLLLLLVLVATSVFVATEKGEFDITKSTLIKSSRPTVFSYVNEFNNWPSWFAYGDKTTNYTFTNVTAGQSATLSWDGNESGMTQTIATNENDSIHQKMEIGGMQTESFWTFKDTTGGTKVTWRVKGKMGFMPKIYAALKGGSDRVIGTVFERSLTALEKSFDREINHYSVKVDGTTDLLGKFFLRQTIASAIADIPKNKRIMTTKLMYFFKKNNITMSGKPFIQYEYFDKSKGIAKFSVCIPVAEEVFISAGSDISSGKFSTFHAVKTTLIGDYSHLPEAWEKTLDYIKKNGLNQRIPNNYIEIYKVSKEEEKSPSKWITEIYSPIDAVPQVETQPTFVKPPTSVSAEKRKSDNSIEEISIP